MRWRTVPLWRPASFPGGPPVCAISGRGGTGEAVGGSQVGRATARLIWSVHRNCCAPGGRPRCGRGLSATVGWGSALAQTTATLNLGFLTVLHEASGYLGGYLVTNQWGRPLEFRLS